MRKKNENYINNENKNTIRISKNKKRAKSRTRIIISSFGEVMSDPC